MRYGTGWGCLQGKGSPRKSPEGLLTAHNIPLGIFWVAKLLFKGWEYSQDDVFRWGTILDITPDDHNKKLISACSDCLRHTFQAENKYSRHSQLAEWVQGTKIKKITSNIRKYGRFNKSVTSENMEQTILLGD